MNLGILCTTLAIGQTSAPPLPTIPTAPAPAPIVRTVPAAPAPLATTPTTTKSVPPMYMPAPTVKTQAPATQTPSPMETKTPEAPAADAPAEEEAKPEEDKFFLQKLLESTSRGKQLADDGWKIYGWSQGHYNTSSSRTTNLPVPFIQRANQFSMNQNWLHVEKAVDTEKKELQLGFAFDGFFGTDYALTLSRNLFSGQLTRLSNANPYGWDIFQAYADVFLPNLGGSGTTLRLGKFATFLEYEVVQGISNPFISRSYLFQYNPFTHTGAMAITPVGDNWTFSNGVVLGADNWFDKDTNHFTYIGQAKWAPKDSKTSIAFGTMITDPTFNAAQNFNQYDVFNLQITHKITDELTYVLDTSYSFMQNANLQNGTTGTADWYGMVHYLFHNVTDKLTSNVRFELFQDNQGIRTGSPGLYTGLTYGLTYKPMPWLYIMPEVRYDNNNGNGNADGTLPFDGRRDLYTAAIGFIVRW